MAVPAVSPRYMSRDFSDEEIKTIRAICGDPAYPTRAAISRAVCDALSWMRLNNQRKDMSARVALSRMERDGLIVLPAPTGPQPKPRRHLLASTITIGSEIACALGDLRTLEISMVSTKAASTIWNEAIGRFHYLG
ncbi:MAG: hypothetical protein ACYDHP_11655 [Ferrimicrobium sp.]